MGCRAITPALVGLASRLEGKPFHLVASFCQRGMREETTAYIKGKGLAPDTPNMTVTYQDRHPQVKGNGYVPYYLVFDHTGRMVHRHMCGDYHGGDGLKMIEWVDELLEKAPEIWLGEEEFATHAKLAERIAAKKHLDKAVLDRLCMREYGCALPIPVVDTLALALSRRKRRHHVADNDSLRLASLREEYNLPYYKAHDCLVDAIATAELLIAMIANQDGPDRTRLKRLINAS